MCLITIDSYPEVVKKMYFLLLLLGICNYVQIGSASSNCTICRFCHDSLNLLNSVTFIYENSSVTQIGQILV